MRHQGGPESLIMGVSREGPRRPRWPDQRAGTVMHQRRQQGKAVGPQVVESRQSKVADCAGQSQVAV
ncbi:hypothetical protein Syun_006398 [Stephania yunnanensis]|uniref:Uncharacterized protein n=1 Tax=Stephania yunnanensis TaxID=152371 RepID=A0AAP0PXI2_9MAGN